MDQRADRCRAFHCIRQPDVERELSRLADCAGKNQERDEGRAGPDGEEASVLQAAGPVIVKEQGPGPAIKPEDAEEKTEIADASGNECLFRGSSGARFMDPKD